MFNFEDHAPLTKDFILQRITEEQIFERYLGLRPEYGVMICNPLRKDNSPGCNFSIDKFERIKFHDPGGGFNWDCFNVVEYLERKSFKEVLRTIAVDFNIVSGTKSNPTILRNIRAKEKIEIRVKRRAWDKVDKAYWFDNYGLTRADLEAMHISPVSMAWYLRAGVMEQVYRYQYSDPCYVYHFGEYDYKLYYPFREKARKHRQTRGDIVQGLDLLPEKGHVLIYTKSYKDVACIRKFTGICDLHSIAPMSETQVIPESIVLNLNSRFDYSFTLFDFDRAGIKLMRKYETIYGIKGLMFGKQYKLQGVKDISDHRKVRGEEATKDLIKRVYEQLINS